MQEPCSVSQRDSCWTVSLLAPCLGTARRQSIVPMCYKCGNTYKYCCQMIVTTLLATILIFMPPPPKHYVNYVHLYRGKVNISGGNCFGHCERKDMNICLILNDYQNTYVWIPGFKSIRLFVGLDEGRSLQKKVDTPDGFLARILESAACIMKREDRLRRTTRDLRNTSCKLHCGWLWNFRTFIVNCKHFWFLISNFRRVVNVVFSLLGDSPASEFYVLTFRNDVCFIFIGCLNNFLPKRSMKMKQADRFEKSAQKIQTPGNNPKKEWNKFVIFMQQICHQPLS
jgi:hypothetical protein